MTDERSELGRRVHFALPLPVGVAAALPAIPRVVCTLPPRVMRSPIRGLPRTTPRSGARDRTGCRGRFCPHTCLAAARSTRVVAVAGEAGAASARVILRVPFRFITFVSFSVRPRISLSSCAGASFPAAIVTLPAIGLLGFLRHMSYNNENKLEIRHTGLYCLLESSPTIAAKLVPTSARLPSGRRAPCVRGGRTCSLSCHLGSSHISLSWPSYALTRRPDGAKCSPPCSMGLARAAPIAAVRTLICLRLRNDVLPSRPTRRA